MSSCCFFKAVTRRADWFSEGISPLGFLKGSLQAGQQQQRAEVAGYLQLCASPGFQTVPCP